jgi:hypothetical protein
LHHYGVAQRRIQGRRVRIAFSTDPRQLYLYVADGSNGEVHILCHADGKRLASFGRTGRMAGEL